MIDIEMINKIEEWGFEIKKEYHRTKAHDGIIDGRAYAYKCGLEDGKRKALEQESVLDKVRNEIAEYGSIWVTYAITGHSDRDIENLIEGVLKQAKEQVLNIIDKYKLESEEE